MDEKLLLLINRDWTSPALDRLMAAASSFDAWWPIIAVLAIVLAIRGDFLLRAFLGTAVLLVAVNDGVVSKSLKSFIDRPRPHQSRDDVRIVDLAKATPRLLALFRPIKVKPSQAATEDVEGRSFPSSHTMNTLAVALAGAAFFGWRSWPLWGVAALVAYSRIYTGSHWPSDILTSLFLGGGCSLLLLALLNLAWRKFGAALCPRVHSVHPELFSA
jgi:undecaprenyl-diphosphatase